MTSRGRLKCGMSGCRLIVPVAVQGASSSTASKGVGGIHSVASAWMISAESLTRRRFSLNRSIRRGSRSTAITSAPATASCAVFPPGAAPKSPTRSPPRTARRATGSAAATSCTQNAPSAYPAISATRVPGAKRSDPVGSRLPPGGPSVPGRGVTSSGAGAWCASAIARASLPQEPHSHAGVSSRGPSSSRIAQGPVSATRRRTAFTNPANGARLRDRASVTAVVTAAWGGVPSRIIPAAPRRRMCRTSVGGRFFRNGSSSASRVPLRRRTAAARRWAAARSRASIGTTESRASSSGRALSSTDVNRSRANSRVGSSMAGTMCMIPPHANANRAGHLTL